MNLRLFFPDRIKEKLWVKALTNFISLWPTMLLAMVFKDLSLILNFTGFLGYFIMLMPMIINYKAKKTCVELFGSDKGAFKLGFLNSNVLYLIIFVIFVVGACLSLWNIIDEMAS